MIEKIVSRFTSKNKEDRINYSENDLESYKAHINYKSMIHTRYTENIISDENYKIKIFLDKEKNKYIEFSTFDSFEKYADDKYNERINKYKKSLDDRIKYRKNIANEKLDVLNKAKDNFESINSIIEVSKLNASISKLAKEYAETNSKLKYIGYADDKGNLSKYNSKALEYIDSLNNIYMSNDFLENKEAYFLEIQKLKELIKNEKYLLDLYIDKKFKLMESDKDFNEKRLKNRYQDFYADNRQVGYKKHNEIIESYFDKTEDEKSKISFKMIEDYFVTTSENNIGRIFDESDNDKFSSSFYKKTISQANALIKSLSKDESIDVDKKLVVAKLVMSTLKRKGKSFQNRYLFGKEVPGITTIKDVNGFITYFDTMISDIDNKINSKENIDSKRALIYLKVINFLSDPESMDFIQGLSLIHINNKFFNTNLPKIFADVKIKDKKYDSMINKLISGSSNSQVDLSGYQAIQNIIKVHSIASLGDMIRLTEVSQFDEQFEKIWGIEKGQDGVDYDLLAGYLRDGYVPQSFIIRSLGNAIYNDLPAKLNRNNSEEDISKLKVELGLYAIVAMQEKGLLEYSDKEKTNIGTDENPKYQRLIKLNTVSKYSEEAKKISYDNKNKTIYFKEDYIEMSRVFSHLYGIDERKRPMLEKPEPKFNRSVRNSFMKVSDDVNRVINDYESTPQKFNDLSKDIYKLWKQNKELAYRFVGIGEINQIGQGKNGNGNLHNVEDAEGQAAKYNNERLELDTLMEFYEESLYNKETGKERTDEEMKAFEFYLPWDYTVSGRYMSDGNVNPQNNKITRFVVQSREMDSEIKYENGKFNEKDLYSLKVGLAQALDIGGIDKSTDKSAFEKMNEVFTISESGEVNFTRDENGNIPEKNKKYYLGFKYFEMLMSDVNITEEGIKNYIGNDTDLNGYLNAKDGSGILELFNLKNIGQVSKAGEGVHGLAAMKLLAELDRFAKDNNSGSRDDSSFKHTFTSESDDITSGMILTLMNIGTPRARELLEKGGVYTKEAIDFWNSVIDSLYVKNETENGITYESKVNGLPTPTTDSKGKFMMTHGFLVEFGKKLDNDKTRTDAFNILSDLNNRKFNIAVLENRVWFKDFYTTVSKDAQIMLDKISDELNEYFVEQNAGTIISDEDYFNDFMNKFNESNKFTQTKFNKKIISDINSKITPDGLNELNGFLYEGDRIANEMISHLNKNDIKFIYEVEEFGNFSKKQMHGESFEKNIFQWVKYDVLKKFDKDSISEINKKNTSQEKKEAIDNAYNKFVNSSKEKSESFKEKYDNEFKRSFKNRYAKNYLNQEINIASNDEINNEYDKNTILVSKHLVTLKNLTNEYNNEQKQKKSNNFISFNVDEIFEMYTEKILEKSILSIAGDEISRSLAKQPVMVFIYGSSLNSIKRLISNTIGKESIYNELIKRSKVEYVSPRDSRYSKVKNAIENKISEPDVEFETKAKDNDISNESINDIDTEWINQNKDNINIKNIMEHNFSKIDADNKNFALKFILSVLTSNNIANNEMDGFAFKYVNNEKNIVENANQEQRQQMIANGDYSSLVITNDMMNRVKRFVDSTFGFAFESTFEKLFSNISDFRNVVKSLEMVRYTIYKYKLDQSIKSVINARKENGEEIQDNIQLTANEMLKIKRDLEVAGFGHSTADSNGGRQSLYKTETNKDTVGQASIKLVKQDKDESGKTKSGIHSVYYESTTDIENTGSSSVTTIHEIDGRKIGIATTGTGALNIYDAFVYGSNGMDGMVKRMNEEFINATSNKNVFMNSLQEIDEMIVKMGDKEVNAMLKSIEEDESMKAFMDIFNNGMIKIDSENDIFKVNFSSYTNRFMLSFDKDIFNYMNVQTSNNVLKAMTTNPEEIIVRHNSLSDSEDAQAKGIGFNFEKRFVNTKAPFRLLGDIVNALRNRKFKNTEFEYLREERRKKFKYLEDIDEEEDNIEIKFDTEVFEKEISIIEKILNTSGSNDYKGIIEEFRKCISGK